MKDKITVFTRNQIQGDNNILNPIAELRNEPLIIINLLQELSDSKLSEDEYLRAKEIVIDVFQKIEEPTLLTLVNALKAEPMLSDFAESIAENALPRAHGNLFN
jgi:hypothetical protein